MIAIAASTALGSASLALHAADDPAAKAPAKENSKAAAAEEDLFAVPEGTDAETLQAYMQKLAKSRPAKLTPESIRDHFKKMDGAAQEIFSRETDEPTTMMAIELRLALLNQLSQFQDPDADASRKALIETLLKDKRPEIQKRGTVYAMAQRIAELGTVGDEERRALIQDVAAYMGKGELSQEQMQLGMLTARNLEELGDYSLAAVANNEFANVLANRNTENNEQLKDIVEMLRGTARRLDLPGKAMEVKGKTHDGKDFDVAQYKGKVVLVDFWATWCGPCMQEMPHVQELYDEYHNKGFEVVGVSLDRDRKDLTQFLEESKVPWIQLFPEGDETPAPNHPLAMMYGVNAIPTAILMDREGLVVSLNARGDELTQQLEKLIGPREKKPEAPKEEKQAEEKPAEAQ
jgi:thiol-disulfide isomerase/thioredoxin